MLYWIILGDEENLLASPLHPSVIMPVHGGMWLSRKSPGLALDNHISGNFRDQSRINKITPLDKTLSKILIITYTIFFGKPIEKGTSWNYNIINLLT